MATTVLGMHGKRNGHGLAAEDRDTSRRGEGGSAEKSIAATPPGMGTIIKRTRNWVEKHAQKSMF